MRRRNELVLRAVIPNAGIAALYRKRLYAMVDEMHNSVIYWVGAKFKANEPRIAQDALPADDLRKVLADLARRWERRFDDASKQMAEHFAKAASERSTRSLKKILKTSGFAVRFQMTPAMRDILKATVNENVSLIKSIPQHYMTQVQGAVMRSVQTGRDIGQLSRDLQKIKGVTKRRAEHIASDQNSKATAAFTRARQTELGIKEAIWSHSYGGRKPRHTHLAAGKRRQRYEVAKGWYDPEAYGPGKGDWIHPGELINCRCVSRAVIPGVTKL